MTHTIDGFNLDVPPVQSQVIALAQFHRKQLDDADCGDIEAFARSVFQTRRAAEDLFDGSGRRRHNDVSETAQRPDHPGQHVPQRNQPIHGAGAGHR